MNLKNAGSPDRLWCPAIPMAGLLLACCKTSGPDGSENPDKADSPGWSTGQLIRKSI